MITFKHKGETYKAQLNAKEFNFNQGESITLTKGDIVVVHGKIEKITRELDFDGQHEFSIVVEVE